MADLDREKVIKGLESLRDVCSAKADMAIGEGRTAWAGYASVVGLALELLREQEDNALTMEDVKKINPPRIPTKTEPAPRKKKTKRKVEWWDA